MLIMFQGESHAPKRAGLLMVPKRYGAPRDTVGVDLVGPSPPSKRGNRYILTVLDFFSHWTELIPIPNSRSKTIAEAFFHYVVSRYGVPRNLLSDKGPQLTGRL